VRYQITPTVSSSKDDSCFLLGSLCFYASGTTGCACRQPPLGTEYIPTVQSAIRLVHCQQASLCGKRHSLGSRSFCSVSTIVEREINCPLVSQAKSSVVGIPALQCEHHYFPGTVSPLVAVQGHLYNILYRVQHCSNQDPDFFRNLPADSLAPVPHTFVQPG
jgi:hypothetical protein